MNSPSAPTETAPACGPLVFLATGFGLATLTPVGPGTVGALIGLGAAAGLHAGAAYFAAPYAGWAMLSATALLLAVGVPICDAGGRHFNKKDPGVVVWDEIATVPLVFLFVPKLTLGILLVGFALHRLFDILKPPPCRQLEKLPGGLGIMADDVAAGLYGLGVMHLLWWAGWIGQT